MKTIGKYSMKPYKCKTCGYEEEHGTNHWGEFYNTRCKGCGTCAIWECLEDPPPGYSKPAKWKSVKLGDIAEITRGGKR
jgi:hypothetical protein